MNTNLRELTAAIAAVAPIDGVSISDFSDKSTWRIDFSPEATDLQKQSAQLVVDNWGKEAAAETQV